jgi:hypothetical protein
MADTPSPAPEPTREPAGRRYTIDEDGNVHGVVLTVQVDYLVEFTSQAIPLRAGSDTPPAAG